MENKKLSILITGCNKNQCTRDFFVSQQLSVVPSHYSLIRCLEDMGHQVTQKLVKVGEDVNEYDKVIVFLAAPNQLTVGAFYNGLWVISQREDCILAFDDWQIPGIMDSISKCKDTSKLFNKFTQNNFFGLNKDTTLEDLSVHSDELKKAIDIICSKKQRVLLSAFSGGNISLLLDYPSELVYTYNPNPYHLNQKHSVAPELKEKKFNFASLVQSQTVKWLKKQDIFEWPVEYFGNKKEKQRRLKESEMVKVFAEQWGCLMPAYKHAGSGWWRARPLQVADCESILIGNRKELEIYYGHSEVANLFASQLENMTLEQLKLTAQLQKKLLYLRHPLDKEVQKKELSLALEL